MGNGTKTIFDNSTSFVDLFRMEVVAFKLKLVESKCTLTLIWYLQGKNYKYYYVFFLFLLFVV